MFFQVGWIVYLFILKCNILDLKKPHFPSPCMAHQVPPCQYSRGKDWALLTQTVDQPLLKIKEKAALRQTVLSYQRLVEVRKLHQQFSQTFTDFKGIMSNRNAGSHPDCSEHKTRAHSFFSFLSYFS